MAEIALYNKEVIGMRVYDPDTFNATMLGAGEFAFLVNKRRFRLYGIDTPERGWRAKIEEELWLEQKGRSILLQKLSEANLIRVHVYDKVDRWGRLLVRLIIDGEDFNNFLFTEKLGVRYNGGKRVHSTVWKGIVDTHHPDYRKF